jgi:hypothetical protein
MTNRKIQISVSKLNEWQQFLIQDKFAPKDANGQATMEAVFQKWLTKTEANENMAVGTAVHLFIEQGGLMNRPDGFQAPHDQGFDIFLPSSTLGAVKDFVEATKHARKAEVNALAWEIEIHPFTFLVVGKIDESMNLGQLLGDHKVSISKHRPDKDWTRQGNDGVRALRMKYEKTVQHWFYMAMNGAEKFVYNQFWFDPSQGQFVLLGQPFFERPAGLVPEMLKFFKEMAVMLISSGYADRLAQYQASWIEKRWPEKTWKIDISN